MNKQLDKKSGLKSSIAALKKEFDAIKKDLNIRQSEIDILKSDAVSIKASKDSLEAEFNDYKVNVDEERRELQNDIELIASLRSEKKKEYDLDIIALDTKLEELQ